MKQCSWCCYPEVHTLWICSGNGALQLLLSRFRYIERASESAAQVVSSDALASVKCAALRSLARVLAMVSALPPSDSKIFTECGPISLFKLSSLP